MNPGELETIIALLRWRNHRDVIEFGCNVGRTAKAILDNVPGVESYIGIEVKRGYLPSMPVQRGEVPDNPGELVANDPRFHLMLRARGSLELTLGDLPECDAVFIDGDHGRVAIHHDTALARASVRPGGIIIWHDYHDLGTVDVRAVLDEYAAHGDQLVHVRDTWLVYQTR